MPSAGVMSIRYQYSFGQEDWMGRIDMHVEGFSIASEEWRDAAYIMGTWLRRWRFHAETAVRQEE